VASAWFVLDGRGQVRAVGHEGYPANGFVPVASRALGIPLDNQPRAASKH
jgi:hypothetical protein